jgi:deoxyribonuclease-1
MLGINLKLVATSTAWLLALASGTPARAETDLPTDELVARCQDKPEADRSFCVRNTLAGFINHTLQTVSYSSARGIIFNRLDAYQNASGKRSVDSVYSQDTLVSGERSELRFNVEHTWPKSKLKPFPRYRESMADLFHLFPTETQINSLRSSLPFTDCDDNTAQSQERVSHLCNGGFEPPAPHRGAVARAMFYMAVTYNLKLDAAQEAVLRKWNHDFPVTESERERDRRIHEVQGAHNPFILFPEWADQISDF